MLNLALCDTCLLSVMDDQRFPAGPWHVDFLSHSYLIST